MRETDHLFAAGNQHRWVQLFRGQPGNLYKKTFKNYIYLIQFLGIYPRKVIINTAIYMLKLFATQLSGES